MVDAPWSGDTVSLVEAFRNGERSPVEELDATLAAIEASDINAFSFLDPDGARKAAANADVTQPFGGVPIGVKELDNVAGWPATEASLTLRDEVADHDSTKVARLRTAGAIPMGLTTASEFGGINLTSTKLNGSTKNPWNPAHTPGGSSGGSAAAVSGGLLSLATGGDGGGSIRIPAGYTGLLGMKGTFGRIPRGPQAFMRPNTVVLGNLARSVRDAARYFDVCGGYHGADPTSLPKHPGYEAGLGSHLEDLRGKRVAIVPDLAGVRLEPGVEEQLRAEAGMLIRDAGLVPVELEIDLPNLAAQWMMGNLATLLADLGDKWPGCAAELTPEVASGLYMSQSLYNLRTASVAELLRIEANEAMAAAFDQVDFVIAATNPGPAFPADAAMSSSDGSFIEWAKSSTAASYAFRGVLFGARLTSVVMPKLPNILMDAAAPHARELLSMGGLTIISNIYGNPAVSIPAGTVDGLPVGMQVLTRHHADELLLDVALAVERERPWPMVAPTAATPQFIA